MEKQKLLISFSGGRTSAFMTQLLLKEYKDIYDMIVVFANTGKEREETLEFVDRCDKEYNMNCVWVEAVINSQHGKGVRARVVDYASASRNGEPFEAMIAKLGMPNVKFTHCTRDLKAGAIHSYAKSIGWKNYYTAIGIRSDEIDRVSSSAKAKRYIYPLVSKNIKKVDINRFWMDRHDIDLKLKSYEGNCDFCFKKSTRKLMTIANENPHLLQWWIDIESKYSGFMPQGKNKEGLSSPPFHNFRNNMSIFDIIEMAKHPFDYAKDESYSIPDGEQMSLFDLDVSNGCTESCEVF